MQFLFFVFLVVGLALVKGDYQRHSPHDLRSKTDECAEDYPLSDQVLAKMWTLTFPNTLEVREHMACVVKKMGIYEKNKGYDSNHLAVQFNVDSGDSELLDHIAHCSKHVDGKDEAQEVYDGFECLMDSKIRKEFAAELEEAIPENIKKIIDES